MHAFVACRDRSQSEPSTDAQQLMAKGLTHALRAAMHCETPQPSSDPTTEEGSGAEGQPPTTTSQSEGLTHALRDPAALRPRKKDTPTFDKCTNWGQN